MADAPQPEQGSSRNDGRADAPPPAAARLHIWQFQAVRDLLAITAVIAVVWVGYILRPVTVPLLIALLLAYLFEPVVQWVMRTAGPRYRLNRAAVVGGLMCTVGLMLAAVVFVVSLAMVNQTARLVEEWREGRFEERAVALRQYIPEEHRPRTDALHRLIFGQPPVEPVVPEDEDEVEGLRGGGPAEDGDVPEAGPDARPQAAAGEPAEIDGDAARELDEQMIRRIAREEALRAGIERERDPPAMPEVTDWWRMALGGAGAVLGVLGGVIAFGFLLFLVPFYFFFFSMAYPRIIEFGRGLIPERNRARIETLLGKMDAVVAGFVRGRIIISLIMGAMFALGWWLIGVPHAILLGFVVGLFCAVPFLGIVGVPLAVGLLFYAQLGEPPDERIAWWGIIFWPTLVFIVVQAIESYGLTPVIAGKVTNLDPVTIIVAVLAGAFIMGVYGMLLAIPVAACLKILITDVLLPRIRAWARGEAADFVPIE